MNYELEFTPEAVADLERLTQVVSERIVNKINWLSENFDLITPEPLTAELTGFYKLRVGDYRVIYSFSNKPKMITIDKIGHRREIYR